jgi:hypothetical protein
MSPEQERPTSEFIQPAAYDATGFEGDTQIDLHASNLVPIEVLRARQAIAAAVATAPSGSLEVNKLQVAAEKIAPQKAIAYVTLNIVAMRKNHDSDKIDLFADDEVIAADVFGTPDAIKSTDTQDSFDLAA